MREVESVSLATKTLKRGSPHLSISQVSFVQSIEQVHGGQNWQQSEVEFATESSLCSMINDLCCTGDSNHCILSFWVGVGRVRILLDVFITKGTRGGRVGFLESHCFFEVKEVVP